MLLPRGRCSGRRFLAAVYAFVALALAGSETCLARPIDEVRASGVLRVIVYSDFKPFSWEEDGKVLGIDADIGRAIAKELGVEALVIARSPGEEVDDDLRSNIWQGPRTGGAKGDVMMHVPMDREFVARNNLVAISNAYYHEHVVLALKNDILGPSVGLEAFLEGSGNKIACEFATSTHYFLAFTKDRKVRNNVSPFVKFESAAEDFMQGGSVGLMGRRAQIEAALNGSDLNIRFLEVEFPETLRSDWNVGTAVKEDSRDLGYAIGGALRKLRSSGELEKIFNSYGVSYVAPR
jgi:polar amino acid transport system substrate-binding protein